MTSARLDPAFPESRRSGRGPIVAGALLGLTLATALSLAGASIGSSLIDPFGAPRPLIRGLDAGALVWLLLVNLAGLLIGVLVALRMQATDTSLEPQERQLRLTVQGLTAWAVATVIAGMAAATVTADPSGVAVAVSAPDRQLVQLTGMRSDVTATEAASTLAHRVRAFKSGPFEHLDPAERGAAIAAFWSVLLGVEKPPMIMHSVAVRPAAD